MFSFKNIAIVLFLAIGTYVYLKYGQSPPDQLVQAFHITSDKNGNNLEFEFSAPVRYLGHFPDDGGDILQVKLRSIGFGEFNENFSLIDRYVANSEVQDKLLDEVRFEGDVPGGPFLVVKFSKEMKFNVTESNGLKGLIISYNTL